MPRHSTKRYASRLFVKWASLVRLEPPVRMTVSIPPYLAELVRREAREQRCSVDLIITRLISQGHRSAWVANGAGGLLATSKEDTHA